MNLAVIYGQSFTVDSCNRPTEQVRDLCANACFNTIAVLFMTELDNITYSVGLSEPVRTLVEVGARLELDKTDMDMLWRSKVAHMSCIMLAVVVIVITGSPFGFGLVPVAFGVAGAVVELGREGEPLEKAKAVVATGVAAVLGFGSVGLVSASQNAL